MSWRRSFVGGAVGIVGALLAAVPGCGASSGNTSRDVSASVDALEAAAVEAALLAIQFDGGSQTLTDVEAAQRAAANMTQALTPAGCVTAQVTSNVIAYTLDGCSGPYGLRQLSGGFSTALAVIDGRLLACVAANGLRAGTARVDMSTWAPVGATTTTTDQSTGSGTGLRGTSYERNGRYTVSWDGSCLTLSGAWSTTDSGRRWDTTVTRYGSCTGQCPEAGSVVTLSGGELSRAVTITYDGDNTAEWTAAGQQRETISLSCGG
ncbi:MAG TPA: hypothetical protein VH877_21525 [Polyangia bacterium]|nr:hypothetical protein [Polyangia bacterium]